MCWLRKWIYLNDRKEKRKGCLKFILIFKLKRRGFVNFGLALLRLSWKKFKKQIR